jgi:streptogramin lyase
VRNIAATLSNAEWLNSLPGSDQQKQFMINCVSCHTLQRVLTSSHDAAEYAQVFNRMGRYSPGSTPIHPQPLLPGPRGERPPVSGNEAKAAAPYLASVTLGNQDSIEYNFQTQARPKGRSTRVIITEYDLPRQEAQPHDVIVDRDGMVWYSDFGSQFAGVLNPKTGEAKDIPIPVPSPSSPRARSISSSITTRISGSR